MDEMYSYGLMNYNKLNIADNEDFLNKWHNKEYFEETCKKVIKTRARVTDELRLLGFDVLDSKTNFVFATHNEHNMKSLFEYLKTQKVFIRYFSLPRIENYVRITIGTDREMDIFLEKTKEFILNDSK